MPEIHTTSAGQKPIHSRNWWRIDTTVNLLKLSASPYCRILIGGSAQINLNNNNKIKEFAARTEHITWRLNISTPKAVLPEILSAQAIWFSFEGAGVFNLEGKRLI